MRGGWRPRASSGLGRRRERGVNRKMALGTGCRSNCGAERCLKWNYFAQSAVALLGDPGVPGDLFPAWICTRVRVVFPQGRSKAFRNYRLFSAFSLI